MAKVVVNTVTGKAYLVGSPEYVAKMRPKLTTKPGACCVKPPAPPPKP